MVPLFAMNSRGLGCRNQVWFPDWYPGHAQSLHIFAKVSIKSLLLNIVMCLAGDIWSCWAPGRQETPRAASDAGEPAVPHPGHWPCPLDGCAPACKACISPQQRPTPGDAAVGVVHIHPKLLSLASAYPTLHCVASKKGERSTGWPQSTRVRIMVE